MIRLKVASNNKTYLNVGCGNNFWLDWNNLDIIRNKNIFFWDVKKDLPYPDNSIDYAYSSHVLEHMNKESGEKLITEIFRVLKPKGIIRLAVPDLEKICGEYLLNLEGCRKNPTKDNVEKYEWMLIELLDQMTRAKSGGYMREALNSKDNIREYMISRIGDAALKKQDNNHRVKIFSQKIKKIINILKAKNPNLIGERHCWMYDNFSLKILLKNTGFQSAQIKQYDESDIADWHKYNLDKSKIFSNKPRKPDSLFMEATK